MAAQVVAVLEEPHGCRFERIAIVARNPGCGLPNVEQIIEDLVGRVVPDQVPKALDPRLDDVEVRAALRLQCVDLAHRLLDLLHPRGDVPPIQNAGNRLADRGADQARQGCLAIAGDRDGTTGLPSLISKSLARGR